MESSPAPTTSRSIRGQLATLFAALAVPLIALQCWWGYRNYAHAREEAANESLILADATAAGIRQVLSVTERTLTTVAEDLGPAWIEQGRCGEEIDVASDLLSVLVSVTVVRGRSEVICSASGPVPDDTSADEWPVVGRAMATGAFTAGTPVTGELSGELILPAAVPIRVDGQIVGTVVGSVPLAELSPFLEGMAWDDDHLVTVATADRIVVARSHDADQWVGQEVPPFRTLSRVLAPGREVARAPDLEGIDRAWGQIRMENGWWVFVGMPTSVVLAPARASLARQLGATVLILIVAMLLAGRSYTRIAGALRELARRVDASSSESTVPLPAGTPAEVRAVVERFNETLLARDRARAAEQSARERYKSIFDNAVFGLYVSTIDGRFLQANASLAEMLGYASPEALIAAGPESLYPAVHVREELMMAAADLGSVEDWEVDWLRADGALVTVRLNGRVLHGADGHPAFEMIVQDITEEKRTEGELRQTQKMEAIGKLAGGIAHDFNNLLTVIGGNLELIEDALGEDDPLRADVDQIREASARASTLTTQLLAFARREPRGARPVNVDGVLREMERLLVRLIGEDVVLEARLGADASMVSIDPSELEQIVMNLVLNARDAMPMGGRVIIETSEASMDLGAGKETHTERGLLISVRDTGVGMDAETSKRIFEPFYTTKPLGEGTGLGLSTVYGIVQRASGHIGVESEPGYGTTLDIWFPLAERPKETAPAETVASEGSAGGNERVLVVEDEELVRTFVKRALEEAGYTVVVASDGQEALETFEALDEPVDLVLTDVVMPRMKGTELAEELALRSPQTPVLYMSGYMQTQALAGPLRENPDILLRKPFTTSDLCERVRLILDHHRLARAGG